MRAQMREIAAAGVSEVVSSWWGWGSPEDVRLPFVLRAAHAAGLTVAVHLEPYPGRTIETVEADLAAPGHPGDHRRLRLPAVRHSRARTGPRSEIGSPASSSSHRPRLPGRPPRARFDGVYTYDILLWGGQSFPRLCSQAHSVNLACLPSVGPGYEAARATGDQRVKPRRDGATYDGMWRSAIRSGADAVTITSYNEWHEGTQIEPARARPGGAAASASTRPTKAPTGCTGRRPRPRTSIAPPFGRRRSHEPASPRRARR